MVAVFIGTVVFLFLLNRSIQYSCLNKTFLLLFQVFLLVRGGEVADYIKCELIGGESPTHLNFF